MIIYIGQLDELVFIDGETIAIHPPMPLGLLEGVGLVTAPTRDHLDRGLTLDAHGPWRAVKSVNYRRRRAEGSAWFHEVEHTEACLTPQGPALRHVGAVATVCPIPGDYICGG